MNLTTALDFIRCRKHLVPALVVLAGGVGIGRMGAADATLSRTNLSLAAGWNLVALPLQPTDPHVSVVLSPIQGQYDAVWAYSAGKWHGYCPAVPGLNDLTTLTAGSGFWIKMKAAAQLEVTGTEPPNAANSVLGQNLAPGWSLVGYSSSRQIDVPDAFTSLGASWDKVVTTEGGAWQYSLPGPPDGTSTMKAFSGYWVHTTAASRWLSPGFRGRVVDVRTGQPLSGASVSLGGIEADVVTDADGSFLVNGISDTPGQMLTVSASGYTPFAVLIDTRVQGRVLPYVESDPSSPEQAVSAVMLERLPAPQDAEVLLPQTDSQWVSDTGDLGIPVQGYASMAKGGAIHVDVIFVIDTSGSTARKTAYDLDKNGVEDTVLDVELYACKRLMNRLKSNHVRCGVIKFARYHTKNAPDGGESDGPILTNETRVIQSLTGEQKDVEAGFDTVAFEGALGGTHTAAGIDLALQAFLDAPPPTEKGGSPTTPVRHIVLLTDGIPTLPIESGETQESGDRLATLAAAERALAANVQIHPVVIDSVDTERPLTTMPSVQAISGVPGGLTRVGLRHIDQLGGKLDQMTFAGIDAVRVTDTSTGKKWEIPTTADGWFESVLPAEVGNNQWQFSFAAKDSDQAVTRTVAFTVQTNVAALGTTATAGVQRTVRLSGPLSPTSSEPLPARAAAVNQ